MVNTKANAVVDILMECREQLQESNSAHLDIEKYREDISKECNVAVDLLKELKEAEERGIQLDKKCLDVKDLPNKMEYSNVTKEMGVVKTKIKDLSNQINHDIRNHSVFLENKKRVKIEIDWLDDVLRVSQLGGHAHTSFLYHFTKSHSFSKCTLL